MLVIKTYLCSNQAGMKGRFASLLFLQDLFWPSGSVQLEVALVAAISLLQRLPCNGAPHWISARDS
jgi:hypothetical protein